ncbi:dihydropteroate synthase [Chitinimonas sp. BJB300]|uniref:dihydropteroate synthase n=1 Tax=Chitinimonas sp. BJB300 TaxID=1559339 RepID=UPI000C0E86B2|nr:dihydropteroate synthase [Chitinimonas sp. BJB300]PHV10825.1 dihydropteroate synthase [Chitinimonas sp. BJB300]TSJ87812.1 dihydropteroate synthase [Chitinimonas sp. BJB300]
MQNTLYAGRFRLSLARPLVMGIVNVTPDSFSDGGRYDYLEAALTHARRLLDEGADMLDIGGESTRPGAATISVDEELARVLPVLRELVNWQVPLSIDTCKTEVMRASLDLGVDLVNDIAALEAPGALEAVADSAAAVCLMHKQGVPQSMQADPHYEDVVAEVGCYLNQRRKQAIVAGMTAERILLDPGFGFGKTYAHNAALFKALPELCRQAGPMLIGMSRKSMLGHVLGGRPASERDSASVAAALLAAQAGAAVLRVHAVRDTVDALKVWQTLLQ